MAADAASVALPADEAGDRRVRARAARRLREGGVVAAALGVAEAAEEVGAAALDVLPPRAELRSTGRSRGSWTPRWP